MIRTLGSVVAITATAGTVRLASDLIGRSELPGAVPRARAGVKPTMHNTGVLAGTALTPFDGDLVVKTAGTVVDSLEILGNVSVQASNVTIRNCIIRGADTPPVAGGYALIMQFSDVVTDLLIEDCTLLPRSPNQWTNSIQGCGMTVRRCSVTNSVDGVDAMGVGNVLVDSCYIHDGSYFTPSITHTDNQTHDDGAQITAGSNIVYSNNTIVNFSNSCFMVEQLQGPLSGLRIVDNWLDGGAASINVNSAHFGRFAPEITGNKFGRSRPDTYQILAMGDVDLQQVTGNVWADTGLPVSVVTA